MKAVQILVATVALALVASGSGQTLTILWSFTGGSDGAYPYAGLMQGSDGNFYGTTRIGGVSNAGTVFRLTPSGNLTNLHLFGGYPSDGSHPEAGLMQGSDGNFYGTTSMGGVSNHGTIFAITPSGSLTNLWSFTGGTDGSRPQAVPVQGGDGSLYGTTEGGGVNHRGTVFRITPDGNLTNLYSFSGSDGAGPFAGLVQGSEGSFYGTTLLGGASNVGTVFRFNPSGSLTNLYFFSGSPDGAQPSAGLMLGVDGNFYGTTQVGGINHAGTVFRLAPGGSLSNLYSFSGSDGANPYAGLVLGSDGNLYGMTFYGGTAGVGTAFQISPKGNLTNLHSFTGTDGSKPQAVLVQGSDGNFYGTTYQGGIYNSGTVFKISVPLNPPANQISGAQAIGNDMYFSIPSVADETYQLQFRTDLVSGNWSNVAGGCISNSIGATLTLTNFGGATGPQGFYRFAITP